MLTHVIEGVLISSGFEPFTCRFVYCKSMTGTVFGQVDHFQGEPWIVVVVTATAALLKMTWSSLLDQPSFVHAGQSSPGNPQVSPEPLAHLPQSRLVPLLLRRAQQTALVQLMMGCSVERWASPVK